MATNVFSSVRLAKDWFVLLHFEMFNLQSSIRPALGGSLDKVIISQVVSKGKNACHRRGELV